MPKEKIIKKNLLFTCNKCKNYNIVLNANQTKIKINFKLLKDIIETECYICKKQTHYIIEFELETESDYT